MSERDSLETLQRYNGIACYLFQNALTVQRFNHLTWRKPFVIRRPRRSLAKAGRSSFLLGRIVQFCIQPHLGKFPVTPCGYS